MSAEKEADRQPEFDRFRDAVKKIVSVPKSEVDRKIKIENVQRKASKK